MVSTAAPMIVDFRIDTDTRNEYYKMDIAQAFFDGNREFNYNAIPQMNHAMKITSKDKKFNLLKEYLRDWDLISNIDQVTVWITTFLSKYGKYIDLTNDISLYVSQVKLSIEALSSFIESAEKEFNSSDI